MKVAFWARVPLANEPSSAVTVWGASSLLVQRTDEPRATVSVAGLNANPTIPAATTELDVGAGVAVAAGVGRGVLVGAGVGADVGRGVAVALGALVGAGVGFRVGTGVAGGRVGAEVRVGAAEGVAGGSAIADAAGVRNAAGEPAAGVTGVPGAEGADVEALGEQPARANATAITATTSTNGRRGWSRDPFM